jgi:hypothetical protein
MITANKITITISEMVLVNSKKEVDGELLAAVDVGAEVDVDVGEAERVCAGLEKVG